VKMLGMPHGILFILYIIFAILLNFKLKWKSKTFWTIAGASIIPFGTFYTDKKYLKN
jgi:integral membrane protein